MKKSKKIIAGLMAFTMTGTIMFPKVESTTTVIRTVNKIVYAAEKGKAEEFVESAGNMVRASLFTCDGEHNFKMNGRTYYQGIILGDGSYNEGSEASFNVENLSDISFDFGHVDDSKTNKSTISIYLDDIMVEQFEVNSNDTIKKCSIDVSEASTMRITSSSYYSKYAMGNISVDGVKSASPAVIPEYKTAEDFIRNNYNSVRITALDDSDSPNALDRKNIKINGRTYYQGIILGDGSYNEGSEASFNVENLSDISFDFGHVDDSKTNKSTIAIYLDDIMVEQFEVNSNDTIKKCSIDVSEASTMRITSSSYYSRYAMGNISIKDMNQNTTTTNTTTTTTKTNTSLPDVTLFGDANDDENVSISDAVLIMQSISNPDQYKITKQGKINADTVDNGDGITQMDALAIQMIEAKIITKSDLPITTEKLNEHLNK